MAVHDLLAVLFGTLIGVSLSAIGGGGSILIVPILVYVMGQGAHAATATSLAVVGATSLAGAIPHLRAGRVSLKTALPFGAAGIGGAFVGAWANHLLPDRLILLLFGILMLVVTGRMLVARSDAGERPRALGAETGTEWAKVLAVGLVVGVMTGFFGVGGGFLIVPALVLVLGFPMRVAVGTSLVVIAINSAAGLFAHLRYGGLNPSLALLFVAGGVLGAVAGAGAASRLRDRTLQRGFALLVLALGVWLIAQNLLPVHIS